jgi:hypothetical protein
MVQFFGLGTLKVYLLLLGFYNVNSNVWQV